MTNEKIYRIPKNLNEEFSILSFYTVPDLIALLLMSSGAVFAAAILQILHFFIVPVSFAVLRFRISNYPAHYWALSAIRYLLGRTTHYNEYTLFEKELKALNGND